MKIKISILLLCLCLLPFSTTGQEISHRAVLLNGTYRVAERSYQVFEFSFDPQEDVGEIGGRINVQGPSNFDIQLWIVDYPNLENFINKQAFKAHLNTGRVRLKTFNVALKPGRYYLIFDNTFSAINSKNVQAFVAVRQFARRE